MKYNKIIIAFGLFVLVMGSTSCKKYLEEAFPNPNKPTQVDPELTFPAMENIMARGIQFDSRFTTRYVQYMAHTTAGTTWDLMGYDPGSDNGGDQWRTHYYSFGQNMLNTISQGRASGRPAYAGAGYAMFAWSWMVLTDNHGEVILKEAFRPEQLTFTYDTQPEVYAYALQLTDSALMYLQQAKAGGNNASFANGDKFIYNGDIDKWMKFTYAIKALLYHRYINKAEYKPDSVIVNVNKSFATNADNAIVKIPGTNPFTDGLNFYGPTRNNMGVYRPTDYLIRLMNGTLVPGSVDPRMKFLFKPAQDDVFRGLMIGRGEAILAANQRPPNPWGFYTTAAPAGGVDTGARHFFKNTSSFPVITLAQLQFTKAEAAFKKGDRATALTAHTAGVAASFDMLKTQFGPGYVPWTQAEIDAYMANPNVIPATSAALTLSHIMVQKYLALWPYASEETWVDLRKYDYDPTIFTGWNFPQTASGLPNFYTDNGGKPAYRIRPRYNSEYLWNAEELARIGATSADYHTKKPWFVTP